MLGSNDFPPFLVQIYTRGARHAVHDRIKTGSNNRYSHGFASAFFDFKCALEGFLLEPFLEPVSIGESAIDLLALARGSNFPPRFLRIHSRI